MAEVRKFHAYIGSAMETCFVEGPRAIDCVRELVAKGRAKDGDSVTIWPQDTARRARVAFSVVGSEVLTDVELKRRREEQEKEHRQAEQKAAAERERERVAALPAESVALRDAARTAQRTASHLGSLADNEISMALHHLAHDAHGGRTSRLPLDTREELLARSLKVIELAEALRAAILGLP